MVESPGSVAVLIAQVPLELLDEVVDCVGRIDVVVVIVVVAERLAAVDHRLEPVARSR